MSKERNEILNNLLKEERSAVETYRQALEKIGANPDADPLRKNQSDHIDNVIKLQKTIQARGAEAAESSGAWGTFSKAVMGTAKIFGEQSTIMALKKGEEHGLEEYQKILSDPDVPSSVRSILSESMIPRQVDHIRRIDLVLDKVS